MCVCMYVCMCADQDTVKIRDTNRETQEEESEEEGHELELDTLSLEKDRGAQSSETQKAGPAVGRVMRTRSGRGSHTTMLSRRVGDDGVCNSRSRLGSVTLGGGGGQNVCMRLLRLNNCFTIPDKSRTRGTI